MKSQELQRLAEEARRASWASLELRSLAYRLGASGSPLHQIEEAYRVAADLASELEALAASSQPSKN